MCAALCGAATFLALGRAVCEDRLRTIGGAFARHANGEQRDGLAAANSPSTLAPRLASLIAGAALWMFIGGSLGVALAIAVSLAGPIVLAKLEPRSTRLRRQRMTAAAPVVADLMASCLASGSSVLAATDAVAQAIGDPVAPVLGRAVAHMELGGDPGEVWLALANEQSLAPIARAVVRSNDSGAPLADILLRVADDLRANRRTELEGAAKTVGIKAVGPLGLCFLPAFLLLGVVPLVASLVERVIP